MGSGPADRIRHAGVWAEHVKEGWLCTQPRMLACLGACTHAMPWQVGKRRQVGTCCHASSLHLSSLHSRFPLAPAVLCFCTRVRTGTGTHRNMMQQPHHAHTPLAVHCRGAHADHDTTAMRPLLHAHGMSRQHSTPQHTALVDMMTRTALGTIHTTTTIVTITITILPPMDMRTRHGHGHSTMPRHGHGHGRWASSASSIGSLWGHHQPSAAPASAQAAHGHGHGPRGRRACSGCHALAGAHLQAAVASERGL